MKTKIFRKNRRGADVVTPQIVVLIVLIASFIIILLLIFRLDIGGTTDKQICHNSVVLRDKSKTISGPLDCKTNYLCISAGEDCDGTISEKVEINPEKEQIMKAITDEMSDCWWMFGEGKTDYIIGGLTSEKACAICSITSFDKKIQESTPTLSYQELYNYLRTTPKSNSQSYLQYLYSVNSLDPFQTYYLKNYLGNNIDTSKEYFILTGISKSALWGYIGTNNFPVVILEKTEENYNAVGCDEFLTKA